MKGISVNMKKYIFSDKEACPVCGKLCISKHTKSKLANLLCDHKCPNCKHELRLSGRIYTFGKIMSVIFWIYAFLTCFMLNNYSNTYLAFLLAIGSLYTFFRDSIVIPNAKIESYDSTPMDDLISNYQKFKGIIKKAIKGLFW